MCKVSGPEIMVGSKGGSDCRRGSRVQNFPCQVVGWGGLEVQAGSEEVGMGWAYVSLKVRESRKVHSNRERKNERGLSKESNDQFIESIN